MRLSVNKIATISLALLFGFMGVRYVMPSDSAFYYRVHVGLSHKGTPIDFDVVVGCGVKVGGDRYSGRSFDVMNWNPYIYAKAISGGHAVLLRTNANVVPCNGRTSTRGSGIGGKEPAVPSDWLPLIVWYDKAEDLSHGLAYVTRDAYDGPQSQLEFHGARIDDATRADYDRFLASAPTNLVPSYLAGWMPVDGAPLLGRNKLITEEFVQNPWKAWPYVERPICRGVSRVRLTAEQKAIVGKLWPLARPQYWSVPANDQAALVRSLWGDPPDLDDLFLFRARDRDRIKTAEVFPMTPEFGLSQIGASTGHKLPLDLSYEMRISIGDGISMRGFMSCDSEATIELENRIRRGGNGPKYRPNTYVCVIDGAAIETRPFACDGQTRASWIVFEDDQFAIMTYPISAIPI